MSYIRGIYMCTYVRMYVCMYVCMYECISSSPSPLPFLHYHYSTPLPRLAPSTVYPISIISTNKIITLHSLHYPPFPSPHTPLSSIPLQHYSPPLPPHLPSPLKFSPSTLPPSFTPHNTSTFPSVFLLQLHASTEEHSALWDSDVPYVDWSINKMCHLPFGYHLKYLSRQGFTGLLYPNLLQLPVLHLYGTWGPAPLNHKLNYLMDELQ